MCKFIGKFFHVVVLSAFISNVLADEKIPDITAISLETLLDVEVFTASKFNQKVSEAPSKVSVITDKDIRTYGYRTLKDILNSISGIYSTYDRSYTYLGVRGFGLPSDYNTRVLMLLDGQRVNDNVYDSFGVDYDSIVNVDIIKRIEFSSGPGSVIYGANAFFGVINIITKNASDVDGVDASVEYASENSRLGSFAVGNVFENGVEALFSGSVYNSDGADLYFPEFDAPATNFGVAEGLDYHKATNILGKLNYENWGFEFAYSDRVKGTPTASYGQEFNLTPSEIDDIYLLANITYNRAVNRHSRISGSLSFGRYDYEGDYIYDYPPLTVNRDNTIGEWETLNLQYETTYIDKHRIVVGLETQVNSKIDQKNFDVAPFASYLDDERKSIVFGLFVQDEIRLTEDFIVNAGIRYNHSHLEKGFGSNKINISNPRVALIYTLQPETTLKLIYGTAYRNANAYELFYGSAIGYLPPANLLPEEIETLEFNVDHYINNNFKLSTSIYRNATENLIGLNSDGLGNLFYDNLAKVDAHGFDLEGEYIDTSGLRVRASYSFADTKDRSTGFTLPNSPENMTKLNASLPIFQKKAIVGLEFQHLGKRISPIGRVGGFGITNLTLSSQKIFEGVDLSASIYNFFDKRYADPASEEHIQNSIVQDGRNFRVKATFSF